MRPKKILFVVATVLLVLLFFLCLRRVYADWLISDAGKKLGESNYKENVRLLNKAARIDATVVLPAKTGQPA